MLRFLSSLFKTTAEQTDGLDEALIETAIEREVAGTDPRIRAIRQYRKRLRLPVEKAIIHVISLVDTLPAPIEINPRTYSVDPRLHAFFISTNQLREVFRSSKTVRDYLTDKTTPLPEKVFGLLSMAMEERKVLGVELVDNTLRRDVMQVTVNFSNHRYVGPASNELNTRRELKKRAFDFLIAKALECITNERSKRRELDRQRHLLKRKHDAMKTGNWGLGAMLTDVECQRPDLAALEKEIEAIDKALGHIHTDNLGLVESLMCVAEALSHPAAWLASREICLRLDSMGIKIQDSSAALSKEIELTELFSSTGERRIVFLGYIARTDIPEPPDLWQKAERYL